MDLRLNKAYLNCNNRIPAALINNLKYGAGKPRACLQKDRTMSFEVKINTKGTIRSC